MSSYVPENAVLRGALVFCYHLKKSAPGTQRMLVEALNSKTGKQSALSNNRKSAFAQAKGLSRKLLADPKLFEIYSEQIQILLDNEFAERSEERALYYLLHFSVIKEDRVTYKCRPIFNGSSKVAGGLSLNDCISPGSNLLPTIFKVLLKFPGFRVALTGDITKAFLTITVDPKERSQVFFIEKPYLRL